MATKTITSEEFQTACNDDMGFCRICKDFTTCCCEPDAERYECDDCGKKAVYGAENALIMGFVDISE